MSTSVKVKPRSAIQDFCVLEIDCPNSYYAYPDIIELQKIPDDLRATLDNLWNRSIHQGRSAKIYNYNNVFVAKEGLVFDHNLYLIPESRTYHSDEDVEAARGEIELTRSGSRIPDVGKCILTKSRGAENYGHFVLEMLPRAWFARKHLDIGDWPCLIHKSPSSLLAISRQALNAVGVPDHQIIESGTEPVLASSLILVDGLTSHTQYLSPFVMQCLDEISGPIEPARSKKIYASRGPNSSRDFHSEQLIASELNNLNYDKIYTGEMDFKSQIAAFKGAKSVVGVMGAALTNIVFCNPGTRIDCFIQSGAAEVLFWMIAQAKRLDYREIRCREIGPQSGSLPWNRAIDIGPQQVKSILNGQNPR